MRTISSGIYKITQISSGRIYIGSSVDIEGRWKKHRYDLKTNRHGNSFLVKAWTKHGPDDFLFEIIEVCERDKATLLEREQHHIDTLKPEFNLCPKAGSRLGSKQSDATKAKISAGNTGKNVGKVRSAETRALMSEIASSISDETRAKMAAAKLGGRASDSTRDKMREAKLGVPKLAESTAKTQAKKNENRLAKLREAASGFSPTKKGQCLSLRRYSDDQIREILNSGDNDKVLSSKYNCSPATIRKIRTRQTYKDVVF